MTTLWANLSQHPFRTNHRAIAMLLAIIAVGAHLGCASSHEVARPDPDECYRGAVFMDCGGDGTPRFGCAEGRGVDGCLWFTDGLVPEDYVGWSCADGQICCDDGAGPAFPPTFSSQARGFFDTHGAEPWTRERALALSVSVDTGLSGDLSVVCERVGQVVDDISPCREPSYVTEPRITRAVMHDTLSVSVQQTHGYTAGRLHVEILPAEGLARACLHFVSDYVIASCDPDAYRVPRCATAGSIRVSEFPARNEADLEGIVVAGEATFEDGLTVAFTVPL